MTIRQLLLVAAALAGCGEVTVSGADAARGSEVDAAGPDAARPDAGSGAVLLRYDFEGEFEQDGKALYVPDVSGSAHRGQVRSTEVNDPLVTQVPREDGNGVQALQFPAGCPAEPCPRAILEVEDSRDLDPGQRDFAITLDILVPQGSVARAQNVIQKGFFDDDGQWKIEIGLGGRASCVFHFPEDGTLADAGMPLNLRIETPINDDSWHALRCERRGQHLAFVLDGGADAAETDVAPDVTIDLTNPTPIRVGGESISQGENGSDQFHGSLDNVAVELLE
jgi:hypothetical protein